MSVRKFSSAIFFLFYFCLAGVSFGQDRLKIGDIQGGGESTPFVDSSVFFEGVVTGVFGITNSRGEVNFTLFLQDVVGNEDGDPNTSDGIAMYVGRELPQIAAGTRVDVTGEVVEFFELTQIGLTDQEVVVRDSAEIPGPTPLSVTDLQARDLEKYEGMRVSLEEAALVIKETSEKCRFSVDLDPSPEVSVEIVVSHPFDFACGDFPVVAVGDIVSGINGVLHYSFGEYLIVQQNPLDITLEAESGLRLVELPPTGTIPPIANGQSAVSNLYITELQYDPIGADDAEEWVEISNFSGSTVNLTDFALGDEEVLGGREGMMRFPSGAQIEAGRSIIVAQTSVGFQDAAGFKPNFEVRESDPDVPNMRSASDLASGEIALSNSGDEMILLDGDNAFVDGISYGESTEILKPAAQTVGNGASLERLPATCDNNVAADWKPQRQPRPGQVTLDGDCVAPEPIDLNNLNLDQLPPIGSIQGDTDVSPYVNQYVAFDGVVTGIHEDQNAAGVIFYTVYIQDLPGSEDGDPATSDGIAVFSGREKPIVQIGDHVLVTGQLIEYFGLTEVSDDELDLRVLETAVLQPTPIEIAPPNGTMAELEAYYEPFESMLVTTGFSANRVIGATYSGCGLAVVRQDTGVMRQFRRSSADSIGQIIPILHNSDVDCSDFPFLKAGDEIVGLSGPLTYNFEQFKIIVQDLSETIIDEAPFPPLPAVPDVAADQFSVISFNVENFFDGIDDTGSDAEPKLTEAEIDRKTTKIAYAIGDLLNCPTIIAIQEVEKRTLMQRLADALAPTCGFDYQVVHEESADGRGIDLAYLVSPRAQVASSALYQTCTRINTNIQDETIACGTGEEPLFSRPPLELIVSIDNRTYTFFNNHFKSKRGGEFATERRRIEQAEFLGEIVQERLAQDPDSRIIVMGDLNDYEASAPLLTLQAYGLTNLLLDVPDEERYSYVFSGASQLIDGILATDRVRDDMRDVQIIHTNADYPDSFADDLSPERIAYKATDHDIPFLVFALDEPFESELETAGFVVPTQEPVLIPTAVPQTSAPTQSNQSMPVIISGIVGLLLLAGGIGFWAGRRAE